MVTYDPIKHPAASSAGAPFVGLNFCQTGDRSCKLKNGCYFDYRVNHDLLLSTLLWKQCCDLSRLILLIYVLNICGLHGLRRLHSQYY